MPRPSGRPTEEIQSARSPCRSTRSARRTDSVSEARRRRDALRRRGCRQPDSRHRGRAGTAAGPDMLHPTAPAHNSNSFSTALRDSLNSTRRCSLLMSDSEEIRAVNASYIFDLLSAFGTVSEYISKLRSLTGQPIRTSYRLLHPVTVWEPAAHGPGADPGRRMAALCAVFGVSQVQYRGRISHRLGTRSKSSGPGLLDYRSQPTTEFSTV